MKHGALLLMAALGLLVVSVVHADPVSDLHRSLARLRADQPLTAIASVSSTVHDADDAAKNTHTQVQVSVTSSADGLQMGFSPALLQRSAQEAAVHAKNKDVPTPIADLLGKLSPVNVQPMVDFASELQHKLDGAIFSSQRDEMHDGKAAHVLVFDVPLPPSAGKQMTIKHYSGQLSVWLGADGVPVAVKETAQIKGRKMLISIEMGSTSSYELRTVGTRLVVMSRHAQESYSVFGSAGDSTIDATLALAAGSLKPST